MGLIKLFLFVFFCLLAWRFFRHVVTWPAVDQLRSDPTYREAKPSEKRRMVRSRLNDYSKGHWVNDEMIKAGQEIEALDSELIKLDCFREDEHIYSLTMGSLEKYVVLAEKRLGQMREELVKRNETLESADEESLEALDLENLKEQIECAESSIDYALAVVEDQKATDAWEEELDTKEA